MPDAPLAPPPAPHAIDAAFLATAADRRALDEKALLPVNLDAMVTATTVLGAVARITPLHDAIASLPNVDPGLVDKLRTYALALAFAHVAYLAASGPAEPLPPLGARGAELRRQLLADARALARRGIVDGRRLDTLRGTTGYLGIASDLGVLACILRQHWSDIASRSAIELTEVDEAERLEERITRAYAARMGTSEHGEAAANERQRAYTLLVRTYGQARRAVVFLRWDEGDADDLAPSLWAGRGGRKKRGKARKPRGSAGAAPARASEGDPRA